MKKTILIELRAAINVSDYVFAKDYVKSRIDDYVNGINSFFKKIGHNENFDCIFVENTTENENDIPQQILDVIPEGTLMYVKNKNNYGKINKGGGDIEMWKEYLDKISEYEYFFHYEPRMILDNPSFIQSFLDNPRNCFCKEYDPGPPPRAAVKTGYFGAKSKDFVEYCNSVDLEEFVKNGISIENHICLFFANKQTEIMEDIKYCIRRWYDQSGASGYGKY